MPNPKVSTDHVHSVEANSFMSGLAKDVAEHLVKYQALTRQLFSLEARVELAEKMLCLARDHFAAQMTENCESLRNNKEFSELLGSARYAGLRLTDACVIALKKHKKMTPEELLADLNEGMFRFKTKAPQREIHAALIKQSNITRINGNYYWVPGEQMKLRSSKEMITTSPMPEIIPAGGEKNTK